jgi:large-conductance mechanosensitive channel
MFSFNFINYPDIKKFVLDNNIIVYIVGWAIAVKFTTMITVVVADLIMPSLYFSIVWFFGLTGYKNNNVSSIFENNQKINLPKVFSEIISAIILFFTVFFLIQYGINNLVNEPAATTTATAEKQTAFSTPSPTASTTATTNASPNTNPSPTANATTATTTQNQQPTPYNTNGYSDNVFVQ